MKNNKVMSLNMARPLSALLVLFAVGSIYISQLIFQEIAADFGIALLTARYAFIVASTVYAVSFFCFGPLSDKFTAKRLSLIGGLGGALCLIVASITEHYFVFLGALSLLGFFAASIPASVFSYTAKTTKNEEITGAMGLMISASVIGIIVGRSAVGLITDLVDWRVSFLIYAVVLLSFSLLFQLIPDEPKSNKNPKLKSLYTNALKMFFNPNILMRFVIGFSLFFGYLGLSSFMTYALKAEPFNLTSFQLSWLNLVGISAVIGSKIAGNISKYIDNSKLIAILLGCVLISISIIGFSTNIGVVALGIFLLFITVFAVQPIIMADLNCVVSNEQKGTISSLYFLSCLLGGSAATYILGYVWTKYQWHGVVYACLSVLAFAIFISIILIKKHQLQIEAEA